MKIVIDINESLYDLMQKKVQINGMRSGKTLLQKLYYSVANGIPLPKGHGRLIDADELKEIWHGCKFVGSIDCLVDCRPTIIDADKESENGNTKN